MKVNTTNIRRIIITFFLFSFLGWVWEGFYVGLNYGSFVNRGFFYGPLVPIYGCGSVLILVLLSRFRNNPWKVFFCSFGICGVLEYVTSYLQEMLFHQRWWDYSSEFMNLNGRICLLNLIAFGIGGVVIVCGVRPLLKKLFRNISEQHLQMLCNVLLTIFIVDVAISMVAPNTGLGITY